MPNVQIVKIGTSSVFHDGTVDYTAISNLGYDLAQLRYGQDTSSVLVVSGAIPLGMKQRGMAKKPVDPTELQSVARVGQPLLVATYTKGLEQGYGRYAKERGNSLELVTAQYLVTYHNLDNAREMRNIVTGLNHDLSNGIVPLINYNDGVDPTEVTRDNDNLAARIAKALIADRLVVLTDVNGLLDAEGNLVTRVREITKEIMALAGDGNGTGGMRTKLSAADSLLKEGIPTIIGNIGYGLLRIIQEEEIRTLIGN